MKNMVFLFACIASILMPVCLFAQEGDDGFGKVRSKVRPYATTFIEKRYSGNNDAHSLEPAELSWGYAFGAHFRFAHFLTPMRIGYYRQQSLHGSYAESDPKTTLLQGMEFSLGYNNAKHLNVFALFRGGKYGKEVWHIRHPDNHLSGFLAFGVLYRLNIGSNTGGLAVEIGMQIGTTGGKQIAGAGSLTLRPYW